MARLLRLLVLAFLATECTAIDWPYSTVLRNNTDDVVRCAKVSGFGFANNTLITEGQAAPACADASCIAVVNAILYRYSAVTLNPNMDHDIVGVSIVFTQFALPTLNYCWFGVPPNTPCPSDPYSRLHEYFREKDAACARQTKLSIFDIAQDDALDRWYDFYVAGTPCQQECIDLAHRYQLFTENQQVCPGIYNRSDPDVYAKGLAHAKYTDFITKACVDIDTEPSDFRYQPGWTLPPTPAPPTATPTSAPPTAAPTPTATWRRNVSTVQPTLEDGSSLAGDSIPEEDGSIVETASGLPKSPTRRPQDSQTPQPTSSISTESTSFDAQTTPSTSSVITSSGGAARTKNNVSQENNLFPTETTSAPPGNLQIPDTTAKNQFKLLVLPVLIAVAFCALFVAAKRRHDRKSQPSQIVNEDTYSALTDTETEAPASRVDALSANEVGEVLLPKPMPIESIQDIRIIGSGGHGVVYLVRDTTNDRLLASKRLAKNHQTNDRITEFLAEIQLVSTLDHPNIVAFVGTLSMNHNNMQALFEYMDGGDLRQYLDQTPVGPWDSLKLTIAIDIADALTYVHSMEPVPIVHRDLKSRNVLLTRSPIRAKLTDFGVARTLSQNCSMTTGVGTGRWLAPEVITGGGDYTTACDIYSFGVVLSEIDTHEVPFGSLVSKDETALPEITILTMVALQGLQPSISESCPSAIAQIVKACLAFDPLQRPKAEEVAVMLREVRTKLGLE